MYGPNILLYLTFIDNVLYVVLLYFKTCHVTIADFT
jgi:hypothetical protein